MTDKEKELATARAGLALAQEQVKRLEKETLAERLAALPDVKDWGCHWTTSSTGAIVLNCSWDCVYVDGDYLTVIDGQEGHTTFPVVAIRALLDAQ